VTAWWRTSPGCGANADSDGLQRWLRDFLRDVLQRRGLSELLADPEFDSASLLDDPRSFAMNSLDMISMASRAAGSLGLDRTGLSDLLLARRSFQGWLEVMRRSLQADDSHIGFYSSGSMGSPTMSSHHIQHLLNECEAFASLLKRSDLAPERLVATVPSHHIYGFIWTQLLPARLSIPVNHIDPLTTLPVSWVKNLRNNDLIVCTPDTWHLILELGLTLPDRFIGISSAGKLAEADARTIRQGYPKARLIEVYGSTETAGIAYRMEDGDDYHLLPYWQIAETADGWHLQHRQSDMHVLLQDDIRSSGPDTIRLLGRRDDTVKINGHNIHLPSVAKSLEQHQDVGEARIVTNGAESQCQLHVFLALKQQPADIAIWSQHFSKWMSRQLGNTPAPASIVVGTALPRSSMGKPTSWNPESYPLIGGTRRFRSAMPAARQ